ncbi:hypothetical protein LTR08_007199 [Meristemomyces frigidus]|nr:hypothetical protein LTR08_007199 [Meristemomyces frigidus]
MGELGDRHRKLGMEPDGVPVRPFKRMRFAETIVLEPRLGRHLDGNNTITDETGSPMAVDAYALANGNVSWTTYSELPRPAALLDTARRLHKRTGMVTPEETAWVEGQFRLLGELEQEFTRLGTLGNQLMRNPPNDIELFMVRHEEINQALQRKICDRLYGDKSYDDVALDVARQDLEYRINARLAHFYLCLGKAKHMWQDCQNFSALIYEVEALPFLDPDSTTIQDDTIHTLSNRSTMFPVTGNSTMRMELDPMTEQADSMRLDSLEHLATVVLERLNRMLVDQPLGPNTLLAQAERLQQLMEQEVIAKLGRFVLSRSSMIQQRATALSKFCKSKRTELQLGHDPGATEPTLQLQVANLDARQMSQDGDANEAVPEEASGVDAERTRVRTSSRTTTKRRGENLLNEVEVSLQELLSQREDFVKCAPPEKPAPDIEGVQIWCRRWEGEVKIHVLQPAELALRCEDEAVRLRSIRLVEKANLELNDFAGQVDEFMQSLHTRLASIPDAWQRLGSEAALERVRQHKNRMRDLEKHDNDPLVMQLSLAEQERSFHVLVQKLEADPLNEVSEMAQQHSNEVVRNAAARLLEESNAYVGQMTQWLSGQTAGGSGTERLGQTNSTRFANGGYDSDGREVRLLSAEGMMQTSGSREIVRRGRAGVIRLKPRLRDQGGNGTAMPMTVPRPVVALLDHSQATGQRCLLPAKNNETTGVGRLRGKQINEEVSSAVVRPSRHGRVGMSANGESARKVTPEMTGRIAGKTSSHGLSHEVKIADVDAAAVAAAIILAARERPVRRV